MRAQYEATQELYRQHGVSTAASYLPLLIQLPIFTGLYFALNIVINRPTLAQLNRIIYSFLPALVKEAPGITRDVIKSEGGYKYGHKTS